MACALTVIKLLTMPLVGVAVTRIVVAFPEKVTVVVFVGTPDVAAVTVGIPAVVEVIVIEFAPVAPVVPDVALRVTVPVFE